MTIETKATLNAKLKTPLTASALKKTTLQALRDMVASETKRKPKTSAGFTATKATARILGIVNVPAAAEQNPPRPSTKLAAIADMLRGGATMDDLVRLTGWKRDSLSTVLYWDLRKRGYGIRTELKNGFQLWQNCSWDQVGTFGAAMAAMQLGHPDDHNDHAAIEKRAREEFGFDPAEQFAVMFLVEGK